MQTYGAVSTNGDVTPSGTTSPGSAVVNEKSFSYSQQELLRLIGQHLNSLGLKQTSHMLTEESGCRIENQFATAFREHILSASWDAAQHNLESLAEVLERKDDIPAIKSLILEEKYLELLEAGDKVEALKCLRVQLGPLDLGSQRLEELSSFAMYADRSTLYAKAGWPGVAGGSRDLLMDKIHEFMPADIMLPPRRLTCILQQAFEYQVQKCTFHNTSLPVQVSDPNVSFLTDHKCPSTSFPSHCHQVLTEHSDEIWHCVWSRDGKTLASCSKDASVILWSFSPDTRLLRKAHVLSGHRRGASFCSFSPDGNHILVCGSNDPQEAKLWNVTTGEAEADIKHHTDDCYSTCAWFPDSKKFILASMRGYFALCDIRGAVEHTWDGVRVQSVAIPRHPAKWVYAADSLKRVRRYDFETERAHDVITEDYPIMSMSISRDGRYALVNCATQGVHVWDLETKSQVRRYRGLTQGTYTIFSSFGGANEDFIASGSEDGKLYVWHRSTSTPVCVLSGHLRSVNSAAWNPVYHDVLVSASDDETLRVWGPNEHPNDEDGDVASPYVQNGKEDESNADRLFSVAELEGDIDE